jgi:GNAT superfamily N-acetyltransferase
MKIRPLVSADIENIKSIAPEDWGDITPYFRYYFSNPNCYTFVAEENGKLIGSGNYTLHPESAWLSHIIVLPEYRNKGYGEAITKLLISEIKKSGCPSLMLIATPMGEPVYKKLGFQTVAKYIFLKDFSIDTTAVKGLRPLKQEDISEVLKLDRLVAGEDRSRLLKSAANGWVVESGSTLKGFYLPQIFEGPVLATDTEAGLALLGIKMKNKGPLVLPEDNTEGVRLLKQNGFNEYHAPGMRMFLGKNVIWQPKMIYGRIAGSFG